MLECNGGHSYSLQESIWSVDRALTALPSARVHNQRPSFYTSEVDCSLISMSMVLKDQSIIMQELLNYLSQPGKRHTYIVAEDLIFYCLCTRGLGHQNSEVIPDHTKDIHMISRTQSKFDYSSSH